MVSDSLRSRLEIKPKRVQNAVRSVFLSLIFVVLGISLVFTRELFGIAIGILSVSYFGFTALSAIIKAFRRNSTLALSEKGIELYKDYGTVLIRWKNIQDIGSCGGYARMVGIKIKSYDEYLAYISPDKADEFMEKQKVWKAFMFISYLLTSHIPILQEERKSLKAYKDVRSMRDILLWSRDSYGYDITLSSTELDRSPDLFLRLLEKYIKKYGDAFAPDDEEY